jgi:hypothetical protein
MRRLSGLLAFLICLAGVPAWAQTPPAPAPAPTIGADPSLTARIAELPNLLAGGGDFDAYFSAGFRAQISHEKWVATIGPLATQLGRPLTVAGVQPVSPFAAMVRVRFERGIANLQVAVAPDAPHAVIGLLFTGVEMANDSFARLTADFAALPGRSGFGVFELGNGAPRLVAGRNPGVAAPLGSAFKLWVLGELTRSVSAGERRWSDVVPLGIPSLPSGVTQAWPWASPVTLHTLATLMISISDNTATDSLVMLEGLKLDRFVVDAGAPGLVPILTTRRMFAIKSATNADLAAAWAKADPSDRRRLLDASAARLDQTAIDVQMFSGKPIAIDTLEWFASPAETATMLDWLRRQSNETARLILAVNPGTDANTHAKFAYVGFKGGSEPGVITLNYLVKRPDGRWFAVVGNWHRGDAGVDTLTFSGLMTRALALSASLR